MRRGQRSAGPALELFVWSRLAVWLAAVSAYLLLEQRRVPLPGAAPDDPRLHDVGWLVDVFARWDSRWFLQIAEDGYSSPSFTPAFQPLYPALVGLAGRLLGGHYVLAGVLVSLAACAGAFVLLLRLARLHLDEDGARRSVLYLALFPTAVFLGAVYSESLYLLLAVATFLLAERGRFLSAGAAAGLAILTRTAGVALLPALAVFAWRSRDRGSALARAAVALPVAALQPLLLQLDIDEPFAFLDAQRDGWDRDVSPLGPLTGLWRGVEAGWAGLRQLAAGADGRLYADWADDTSPLRAAALSVEMLAFLLLFLVLAVLAWRRFGAPYGLFALVSLALPLSAPPRDWPLLSLPRFGLVIFPLFLALATLGVRPRVHAAILGTSAILLGVFTTRWAIWEWVA